jgi:Ca2+/Na+ antiporter
MFIILLYYILLFFLVIPFGIFTTKITRINNSKPSIIAIFGLVFLTLFFSVWAFFYRLNIEVFLVVFCSSALLYWIYKTETSQFFSEIKNQWYNFNIFYKWLFGILVLLTSIKSTGLPFVVDNESYYIQTIKWLNEYGFVKGLGNLHLFLAQNSGWHTLQAGLNLSFLTDRINDLNGFLLIICTFFYLSEFQQKNEKHWIGFILLFNVLLFQFVDAPSPDLPLLLITPILFYFFTENQTDSDTTKTAILLFAFLVFVKITVVPFGLLFLLWIKRQNGFAFLSIIGLLFGTIWISKNCIISGYPFYPFPYLLLDADWTIPQELYNYTQTNDHIKKFSLFKGGLTSFFNIGTSLLFIIAWFLKPFRKEKNYQILYVVLLIHFVLTILLAPQYRFFLPEFIFLSVVMINLIIKIKAVKPILIIGIFLPLVFMVPLKFSYFTDSTRQSFPEKFEINQFLVPQHISRFDTMQFEEKTKGNLKYHSPAENFFFFGTANGNLPCVNEAYLYYFEYHYGIFPQMRGASLKDGFYSKRIE